MDCGHARRLLTLFQAPDPAFLSRVKDAQASQRWLLCVLISSVSDAIIAFGPTHAHTGNSLWHLTSKKSILALLLQGDVPAALSSSAPPCASNPPFAAGFHVGLVAGYGGIRWGFGMGRYTRATMALQTCSALVMYNSHGDLPAEGKRRPDLKLVCSTANPQNLVLWFALEAEPPPQ